MASELVRNVWCDVHGDEDRQDVGEAGLDVPFRVGEVSVVMDLCDKCITEQVTPFAEFLVTYGRKATAGAVTAGADERAAVPGGARLTCAECGKTYAYRASLQSHMMDVHGQVLPRKRGGGGPVACPHCGKTYQGAAGLSSHVKSFHPDKWTGPKN